MNPNDKMEFNVKRKKSQVDNQTIHFTKQFSDAYFGNFHDIDKTNIKDKDKTSELKRKRAIDTSSDRKDESISLTIKDKMNYSKLKNLMSKLKGEQDEIKDKEPTNNRNGIPRSNFGSNLNNV